MFLDVTDASPRTVGKLIGNKMTTRLVLSGESSKVDKIILIYFAQRSTHPIEWSPPRIIGIVPLDAICATAFEI